MDERNAKGQGSFRQNPDGTFTYRKGVGYKEDGKRKTLTVTGKTRTECLRIMREKEAAWEKEKSLHTIRSDDTVEELCTRHLLYQVRGDELKPKSVDRREGTIKNQISKYPIGQMQVSSVTSADIAEHTNLLVKADLSASSINKVVDVLGAAYDWGISRGELNTNPVHPVKKSLKRKIAKYEARLAEDADVIVLSEDEEKRFVEECRKKDAYERYVYAGGLFGSLLLHTGMRVGEMISLRWEDLDKAHSLLTINKSTSLVRNRNQKPGENNYVPIVGSTKNQKARVIQLSEEALYDLEMIFRKMPGKESDLICRSRNGNQYSATMMEHCISTIYKSLGFDSCVSGLHVLRRTFATRMYENGAGVKEIAAYIGDLESTTMQYYISARRKMKIGTTTTQFVPIPISGKEKNRRISKDER